MSNNYEPPIWENVVHFCKFKIKKRNKMKNIIKIKKEVLGRNNVDKFIKIKKN